MSEKYTKLKIPAHIRFKFGPFARKPEYWDWCTKEFGKAGKDTFFVNNDEIYFAKEDDAALFILKWL